MAQLKGGSSVAGGFSITGNLSVGGPTKLYSDLNVYGTFYASNWIHSKTLNTGLYNESTAMYFYSNNSTTYAISTNSTGTYPALMFRSGHEGTIRGYLYSDGGGFGLLNNGGSWWIRNDYGTANTTLYGSLTLSGNVLGPFVYDPGSNAGFNEGLRIASAASGWSNLHFGTNTTASGRVAGQWLIGKSPEAGNVGFVIRGGDSDTVRMLFLPTGGAQLEGYLAINRGASPYLQFFSTTRAGSPYIQFNDTGFINVSATGNSHLYYNASGATSHAFGGRIWALDGIRMRREYSASSSANMLKGLYFGSGVSTGWNAGVDPDLNDYNHVLWNDYGAGFDGMRWNLYTGIQLHFGAAQTAGNPQPLTPFAIWHDSPSALATSWLPTRIAMRAPVMMDGALGETPVLYHGGSAPWGDGSNRRLGITIQDNYPAIALVGGGASNTNHGATLSFVGLSGNDPAGTFKAWTIGTPGMWATDGSGGDSAGDLALSIGWGATRNPHSNGLHGSGNEVIRLRTTGNHQFWGSFSITGSLSIGSNYLVPSASLYGLQDVSATAWIRPRDTSNNLHISTDVGGIYLDANNIYLRNGSDVNIFELSSSSATLTTVDLTLTSTAAAFPMLTLNGGNSSSLYFIPLSGGVFKIGNASNGLGEHIHFDYTNHRISFGINSVSPVVRIDSLGFYGPGSQLTDLNASNVASGNLAMARMPTSGTLPAYNGSALTNVDAKTIDGFLATAASTETTATPSSGVNVSIGAMSVGEKRTVTVPVASGTNAGTVLTPATGSMFLVVYVTVGTNMSISANQAEVVKAGVTILTRASNTTSTASTIRIWRLW